MLGNVLLWTSVPFVCATSHLLDIGVKYRIMNHQTMKETEPLTKGIVIFGATGDLCRKKLIPALYKLWEKELLPEHFVITGAARRERTTQQWIESLGMEYPEGSRMLDYQSCDLEHVESLQKLPNYLDDNTYFLSVPPERYESAITNLKDAGLLEDPIKLDWLSRNPLGTIINLLIVYSLWWSDLYARNKFIALTIILAKILLTIYLLLDSVIYFSNHFGIGIT